MKIPESVCKGIKGILFDIDDTFTLKGKILAEAFSAIWEAREAGMILIPVTGRPAGWADHIARMWPVDGVVGENGAFYFCMDTERGRLKKRFFIKEPAARAENRNKLRDIFLEVEKIYPGINLASDQPYRECDLAVDFCEDVSPPLSLADARRIKEIFEASGAHAKISSIHVNAWFGDYDKLVMCKQFLQEEKGINLELEKQNFFYCGDSPNDSPMFAFFPYCAGVSGIRRFQEAELMEHMPPFVASRDGSMGFQEIVRTILAGRRS